MKRKKSVQPAPDPARIPLEANRRYTIPEASALLKQGQSTTFEKMRRGEIRVIRDGGRTFVPGSEIIRLSTLPDDGPQAA